MRSGVDGFTVTSLAPSSNTKEGKVIADQALIQRILDTGIRKTARATGVDSKTVILITRREPVKPNTLAQVAQFMKPQQIHVPEADAARLRAGGRAGLHLTRHRTPLAHQ